MNLKIHILNVGHGSCAIIEHPSGHVTMIDINNGSDIDDTTLEELSAELAIDPYMRVMQESKGWTQEQFLSNCGYDVGLTNPVAYLKQNIQGKSIWRFILTHPDLDHMRGLVALRNAGYRIDNFWDTSHNKQPDFHKEGDEEEWAEYERLLTRQKHPTVLLLKQGGKGQFYNEDELGNPPGDGITILAPIPAITEQEKDKKEPNYNNLSYVIRLEHRGRKIIFGGDAEKPVWKRLLDNPNIDLNCDILIAPHHGRDSAYHSEAVAEMDPEYVIVSVGKKPETDASNKYRKPGRTVWSTRWMGNITIEITDNGEMFVTPEHNRGNDTKNILRTLAGLQF